MFFTLITPVYNIEKLLPATINSALEQTFTDWEMILVDDGSPDNACALCDKFAAQESRIKVIHKQNAGLAAARNTGLKEAKGKYFLILEGSDLFYDNNTLQDIHDDIIAQPSVIDIYFGLLQDKMEHTGEISNVQATYCVNGLWRNKGEALVCRLYDHNDILALSSPVNKAFRRDFVLDHKLWFHEGIYHDDDEWLPKTIAHSKNTFFTDRIIYNALTWDGCFGGNVSDKGLTKKAVDKMLIAETCCDYFATHFPDNKDLLKRMYTYYVRMYIEGVAALNHVKDRKLLSEIYNAANLHRRVFQFMGKTDSRNLRLLSFLSNIIGQLPTLKMLKSRYK